MSDALARVKAWPETCPDIEALVREVEAGRELSDATAAGLRFKILAGWDYLESQRLLKAARLAYDAARKGTP